jgi:hypothetical protein
MMEEETDAIAGAEAVLLEIYRAISRRAIGNMRP